MWTKVKKMVAGAATAMLGLAGSAHAAVIDPVVMDAHVADVQADIGSLANYGIVIILSIMAVLIVYSLLKRGK